MKRLPNMTRPCKNCPFRTDCKKGWLGEKLMAGILKQGSFVCHKTARGRKKDRLQCAGHMLLMGEENEFVSLAKVMRIDVELAGKELVFETKEACIEHHK